METYPKNTEVQPRAASGIEDDTQGQTHRDQEPSDFKNTQQVAEEALGKIEWVNEIEGFHHSQPKQREVPADLDQLFWSG